MGKKINDKRNKENITIVNKKFNKDFFLSFDCFYIIAKPNKNKTEILEYKDKIFYMNVKEKPIEGKANKEIIRFFKKEYKINISIKSGATSKKKLFRILD